jgi:hypothetical protein
MCHLAICFVLLDLFIPRMVPILLPFFLLAKT